MISCRKNSNTDTKIAIGLKKTKESVKEFINIFIYDYPEEIKNF